MAGAPIDDASDGSHGRGSRARTAFIIAFTVLLAGCSGFGGPAADTAAGNASTSTTAGSVDGASDGTDGRETGDGTRAGAAPGVVGERPVGTDPASDSEVNTTLIEREIHERINEIRTERDRSPLDYSPALAEISTAHSRDMAEREYFSHVSPEGETFADRYDEFGYDCRVQTEGLRYSVGGENLAYTYAFARVQTEGGVVSYDGNETRIARGVVEGWLNSPGHRKNVLRPYWENEGLGVVLDPENGRTQVIATQNFC